METGTSSPGSSSKRSPKKSTSSNRSRSRHTGTVSGRMIMDIIIQQHSDGSVTMRTATPIFTGNLLKQGLELTNLLSMLTDTQIQEAYTQSLRDMIAGL